jgi:prepilin-type N-terminal cleavage/methylation domain-containing protein
MNIKQYKMKSSRRGNGAFTLMELLVVIFIIALLVAILLPTVNGIIAKSQASKTIAWIDMLKAGCETYRSQYGFYPGQDPYWSAQLANKAYTGSEVLCVTLLGQSGDAAAGNVMPTSFSEPNSVYWDTNANPQLPTNTRRPATPTDTGTISTTVADKFGTPMPILYYPARLSGSGLSQYVMTDNSTYCNGGNDPQSTFTNSNNFSTYITDPSAANATNSALASPFRPGGFILVSAGVDRMYGLNDPGGWGSVTNATSSFKCDDIRNYSDSRN